MKKIIVDKLKKKKQKIDNFIKIYF